MPYVNVPNDLSKIKTKIAFNLTKRQLICFGFGAAIGVPTYLESNTGYHIVKVISHNDARMLTLDDRIDPTQNYTVRDYITEGLAYQNYQTALTEALNDLIAELRSEASIRILYK